VLRGKGRGNSSSQMSETSCDHPGLVLRGDRWSRSKIAGAIAMFGRVKIKSKTSLGKSLTSNPPVGMKEAHH